MSCSRMGCPKLFARIRTVGPGRRKSASQGFTYIELIVVLVILAVLFSTIVPVVRSSARNLSLSESIRDIAALARHAQIKAITMGEEQRLYISRGTNRFWVTGYNRERSLFEVLPSITNGPDRLPDGARFVRSGRRGGRAEAFFRFYPNGACDPGQIVIQTNWDRKVTLKLTRRLGRMEIEDSQSKARR